MPDASDGIGARSGSFRQFRGAAAGLAPFYVTLPSDLSQAMSASPSGLLSPNASMN